MLKKVICGVANGVSLVWHIGIAAIEVCLANFLRKKSDGTQLLFKSLNNLEVAALYAYKMGIFTEKEWKTRIIKLDDLRKEIVQAYSEGEA